MRDTKDHRTIKVENVGPEREKNGRKEQDVLKVEVYYNKGGANYFNGGTDPRGYWISVTPSTLETDEEGRKWERTRLGKGYRKHVKEAARFSAKTFEEVVKAAEASTELQEKLKALTLAEGAVFAPS